MLLLDIFKGGKSILVGNLNCDMVLSLTDGLVTIYIERFSAINVLGTMPGTQKVYKSISYLYHCANILELKKNFFSATGL